MQIHASCAARHGHGVLILGPSSSGKSDLTLRLIDIGFMLVADDRVDIEGGMASAPPRLAGLMEVRGIGLIRMPFLKRVRLRLAVRLGLGERLPDSRIHPETGLRSVTLDGRCTSAPGHVRTALNVAVGQTLLVVGGLE